MSNENDANFPARLRAWRLELGLSQELAARRLTELLGVVVLAGTLRGWEQGRHRPGAYARQALERVIERNE